MEYIGRTLYNKAPTTIPVKQGTYSKISYY